MVILYIPRVLTLNSEFSRAGDVAGTGLRHAGVEARVFRPDVLEDQGQRVRVVSQQHLEALLGVEGLSVAPPAERGFLARGQHRSVHKVAEYLLIICGVWNIMSFITIFWIW